MRIGFPVSARNCKSRASPTSATFVVMRVSANYLVRFDLKKPDWRSNRFYLKHNLIDPRFTPTGLML
jgi:hypothetical protein